MSDNTYIGCGPGTGCWHSPGTRCVCVCHKMARLNAALVERDAQITQLRADLREYGRHAEGCSAGVGNYPCKCGWAEVEMRLKGGEHE